MIKIIHVSCYNKPLKIILDIVTKLALFITGGIWAPAQDSVESWRPEDGTSCSLPPMTRERYSHTISGGLACGGSFSTGVANITCEVWRPSTGQWHEVVTNLTHERNGHVSWTDPEGTTFLIGGYGAWYSVETVSEDFTVAPASFSLEHDRA